MRTFSAELKKPTGIHRGSQRSRNLFANRVFANCVDIVALLFLMVGLAFAQASLTTSHGDNTRSASDTNETLLTPENVNKGSFGHLFSVPVDYEVLAQPLYVSNVTINTGPYLGTVHNVVYVATQMDSLYAFDADDGTQLWYESEVIPGGVAASGKYLPCGNGGGFLYEGIVGTPVIDLTT